MIADASNETSASAGVSCRFIGCDEMTRSSWACNACRGIKEHARQQCLHAVTTCRLLWSFSVFFPVADAASRTCSAKSLSLDCHTHHRQHKSCCMNVLPSKTSTCCATPTCWPSLSLAAIEFEKSAQRMGRGETRWQTRRKQILQQNAQVYMPRSSPCSARISINISIGIW
jgi:hypothetical protein